MTIIDEYLQLTERYKKEYADKTLVLLQVGSFFECYALLNENTNTYIGSNILDFSNINDLVISKKHITYKGLPVVMAGFGITQIEKYIRRLQEHDYTIVVYTQDSNSKNTTRSLSCIYSPGTYFSNDSNELTNVTTSIWIHYSSSNKHINEKITIGMASIDIYTGNSNTCEYTVDYIKSPTIFDTLENYININNPSECLLVSNCNVDYVTDILLCKCHRYDYDNEWIINVAKQKYQYEIIQTFFNKDPSLIFNEWNICTQSYCLLIQFIYKHNPNLIKKIQLPTLQNIHTHLLLANHSLKQLNIIPDHNYNGKYASVSTLLNNCITSMGKRAFHYQLLNPSIDYLFLHETYEITEYAIQSKSWQFIRSSLMSIKDLSKIYRKIILGKLSPKDFYNIYNNLSAISIIYSYIMQNYILADYIQHKSIDKSITGIQTYLGSILNMEHCQKYDDLSFDKFNLAQIFDIRLFQETHCEELNTHYNNFYNAYTKLIEIKDFLELSIKEYESKSPVTSKIGKNTRESTRESTEYIKLHECPKTEPALVGTTKRLSILKKIMNDLTCNLFKIEELEIKSHNGSNSMITSTEINTLCKSILKYRDLYFNALVKTFNSFSSNFINQFENDFNDIITYIVQCDTFQNRCYIATNYNYCKPTILDSSDSTVDFIGLRHPLIEKINTSELYVTNDLNFNENSNAYLLYGTNAVGKTSFIKSIGISIIMAQAGLYVPAEVYCYSVYRSIYTRILGNDNIFKGLSTFAVEMTELRNILKNADSNSLILGDELCSGTESTSALSIFTAGIQYLSRLHSSFIFATHFHEIIHYSEIKNLRNLKLLHMSVIYDKEKDNLVYDRKLKEGPGESMYGLEVCKALNLPDDFLDLAHTIRHKYSGLSSDQNLIIGNKTSKYNSQKIIGLCEICKENKGTEIHHLIYQQNTRLSKYNAQNKNHKANLINICEKCHDIIHLGNYQLKIFKTSDGFEIR